MWLVSGGAFQGKLEYVLNRKQISLDNMIDGETCDFQDLLEKPLVTHFHLWVKRMLLEKRDVADLVDQMIQKNPDIIIIVNELGCGIVPMDAFDREY
jgi:adenosylcobinamide kinase/adenosylcobinamide-phosphate guanylyltransferase